MNRAVRQYSALPIAQRGAIVLLLLLILAVSTASYFLVKRLNSRNIDIKRDKITAAALAQAKAALIGRAISDDNRPGSMPCPDTDNNGSIEMFTGITCPSNIGRLPWRTLDLPDIRDGNGERLWLAISPSYRDHPSAEPVNPFITLPDITLDNPAGPGNYVALIIAPGAGICSQDRSPANQNNPIHYLELDNNNGNNNYISRPTSANTCEEQNFNDKIIGITRAELQPLIQKRFERIHYEAAAKLLAYFNTCGAFPWARTFLDPSTIIPGGFESTDNEREGLFPADSASWGSNCGTRTAPQFIRLNRNNWYNTFPNLLRSPPLYYAIGSDVLCAAPASCLSVFNRDTMATSNNIPAIVIHAGVALSGQAQPSGNITSYFENENASSGDNNFESGSSSNTFNDLAIPITP